MTIPMIGNNEKYYYFVIVNENGQWTNGMKNKEYITVFYLKPY